MNSMAIPRADVPDMVAIVTLFSRSLPSHKLTIRLEKLVWMDDKVKAGSNEIILEWPGQIVMNLALGLERQTGGQNCRWNNADT